MRSFRSEILSFKKQVALVKNIQDARHDIGSEIMLAKNECFKLLFKIQDQQESMVDFNLKYIYAYIKEMKDATLPIHHNKTWNPNQSEAAKVNNQNQDDQEQFDREVSLQVESDEVSSLKSSFVSPPPNPKKPKPKHKMSLEEVRITKDVVNDRHLESSAIE